MPWIANYKRRIEQKSTKSSRSSSKVVVLGPAELPTLIEAEWCIWASVNEAVIGSDDGLSLPEPMLTNH